MRRGRRARTAVAILVAFGAFACGRPAQIRYEEAVEEAPPPTEHAVHSERLQELMRGLQRLRDERLPKAMDARGEERRRREEVRRVARAMQASASRIPEALPAGALTGASRDEFAALAATLEQLAERLADDLDELGPEETRRRLREIETTCNSCHTRFRIRSGSPRYSPVYTGLRFSAKARGPSRASFEAKTGPPISSSFASASASE